MVNLGSGWGGFGGTAVEERGEPASDGRRLRRERNREAVVDALLDLYRDGNLRPSAAEVAERAGLSPRSLFRYFEDLDDLLRAAVSRQQRRARPLLAIDVAADAPLRRRVEALVAQRLRLFEAVAPAATVSRIESPFQPLLAAELTQGRAFLRHQILDLFRPELAAMGSARADRFVAVADVLCSFESHQLLRLDQRLPASRARAALVEALVDLLEAGGR